MCARTDNYLMCAQDKKFSPIKKFSSHKRKIIRAKKKGLWCTAHKKKLNSYTKNTTK